MSNLENLTAKIVADGEQKARAIRDEANAQAQAIIARAESEAEAEARKALAAAEEEAKRVVALALSAKRVALRDESLSAKQRTIARVLDAVKEKLSTMDAHGYETFLFQRLRETAYAEGETLRIPKRYAALDMNALNQRLKAENKPALVLDTAAYVDSGFKLVKDDVENDNSFDALIDYYRATLERMVVEALF